MTLALLSTPEQIKNDRKQMNIVLDDIFDTLVLSARAQDYRYQHRFHVSEPLVVLVKLFSYDRTLDYIMQHAEVEQLETATTLEFLLDFFFKYYATVKYNDPLKLTTMTALCNIFWSVSLQPQYKQELYEDKKKFEEFKKLIQQIAYGKDNKMIVTTPTHYVPTYIENIRKAANGILCNIVEQQQSETQKSEQYGVKKLRAVAFPLKSSSIDSPSIPKPSIMISYSHGDNDVCTQLYNELNKRNNEFDIWIDRQCCKTGYLWGKIADGIQEASVILCLLSNKYYESKSCQQEFVYANDHLKKQIIPVFIQNDKPPGWLAIHTCLLKYVRFRQTQPLEKEKLKDLMEMIDEYLLLNNSKNNIDSSTSVMTRSTPVHRESIILTERTTVTPVTENKELGIKQQVFYRRKSAINLDEKPISQWNRDDVAQWFQQNKIMPELYKLYEFEDGPELLTYARTILNENVLKLEQQLYSQAYSQTNNGKVLLTPPFLRFTNALRKLHYDAELKMQKSTIVVEPIIMNASNTVGSKPTTRSSSRIPRRRSTTKPHD
ncbi:unnamed protein product [Rotaria sordida]|uniref:TIR domain-containing protein n=1 Tax=Rotaria sordida TaxID=392033 RepID=A0A815KKZ3_9BILA|nr:unnamed protein product [Rotaria sordida]